MGRGYVTPEGQKLIDDFKSDPKNNLPGAKTDRDYQRTHTRKLLYTFKDTMSGGNHRGIDKKVGFEDLPTSIQHWTQDLVIDNPVFQEATRLGLVGDNPTETAYRYATRGVQGPIRKPINPTNNLRRLEDKVNTAKLKSSQEEEKRRLTQEIMESERRVTTRRRNPRSLLAQLPSRQDDFGTLGAQQTLGA